MTDGDIAVFDALSLEKLCSFDGLPQDDDSVKPVLALGLMENGLLVTGDSRLYVYDSDFSVTCQEQK